MCDAPIVRGLGNHAITRRTCEKSANLARVERHTIGICVNVRDLGGGHFLTPSVEFLNKFTHDNAVLEGLGARLANVNAIVSRVKLLGGVLDSFWRCIHASGDSSGVILVVEYDRAQRVDEGLAGNVLGSHSVFSFV